MRRERRQHRVLYLILVAVVSLQLVLGGSWSQVLGQCIGEGGNCPKTNPDFWGPNECFSGHYCTVRDNCPPDMRTRSDSPEEAWVFWSPEPKQARDRWVSVGTGENQYWLHEKRVVWRKFLKQPCAGGCGFWWEEVRVTTGYDEEGNALTAPVEQEEWFGYGACICAADPVLLPSGVYLEGAADLRVPYLGGVFEVYRRYSADGGVNDVLGRGWQSALHKSISVAESGDVTVNTLAWQPATFTYDEVPGTFSPPAGSFEKLERVEGDYVLTFKGGGVWYFDGTDCVRTKSTDANGNEVLYQYDVDGVLTGMTDPGSRQYTLLYDAGGRLTRVTDVGGRSVTYEYDTTSDVLTKVTLPSGAYTAYGYYSAGLEQYKMQTRTYSGMTGANMANWYDAEGRVTRQTLGSGDFTLAYAAENVVTQTDRDGNRQIFFFTANNLRTKELIETNRGVREGEGDYESTFVYDGNYLLLTRQVPSGSSERGYYDGTGNETKRTQAGETQSLSAQYWYDGDNNRISLESPRGYRQQYKYDANRNLTRKTMPTVTLGQPSSQTVEYVYGYDAHGLATRAVGPGGMVTAYLYDGNGYPTKVVRDEGGLNVTAQMKYDAIGNVTESINVQGSKVWSYYDAAGRLTKQAQILDNSDPSKQYATTYWYNDSGLLASKAVDHKDQDGAALSPATYLSTYVYDLEGRVTRAIYQTDAENTVTASTWYDAEGLVTRTVGPNGTGSVYTYDERNTVYQRECEGCGSSLLTVDSDATGWVTKAVDGNGNVVLQYYDELDRMTRKSHYDNQTPGNLLSYEELAYDADDNVTRSTVRDASGNAVQRTTSLYDELDRLYEERTWADPAGAPGDNDVRTVYLYDAGSRVTKVKRYLSGTDASPTVAETSSHYDSAGRLTRTVDAEGGASSNYYATSGQLTKQTDAEGRDTIYTYDGLGRATRATDAAGRYAVTRYDSRGNALTSTSYSSGGTALAKAAYDYDGAARVTKSRRFASPAGAADDDKDSVVSTYYDASGLVTKAVAPNGSESTASYDETNTVTCRRDALGNRVEYVYDDNNNVITTISYEIDMVGGSTKTFTTAMLYDGLNRATKVVNQGADGDISQSADNGVTVYEYDALDKRTRVTDPEGALVSTEYDPLGRVTKVVDQEGNAWTYLCDRAGRVTRVADPLSHSNAYSYDKTWNLTREENAEGNATTYACDLGGRTTKVTDPEGNATVYLYGGTGLLTGVTDAEGRTVTYYYDALGSRTQLTDARGNSTSFSLDGLGQLTRLTYANGDVGSYFYDKGGRLTRNTDPNGTATEFLYDAGDNITRVTEVEGSIGIKCHYDGGGYATKVEYTNDGGTSWQTTTYECDGVRKFTKVAHVGSKTVCYAYDKSGRWTRMVDPASNVVSYFYNGRGALTRIQMGETVHGSWYYDDAGRTTKLLYGNGSYASYLYDDANRLTMLSNKKSDNSVISSFTYAVDDTGNRTKVTLANGHYMDFLYDDTYQLTKEHRRDSGNDTLYYNIFYYDAVGNRTRLDCNDGTDTTTTTYLYNEAGQLTRETTGGTDTDYLYDANGNLTKKDDGANVYSYAYDVRNLMTKYDGPGTSNDSSYAYDAWDRRITKDVNGTRTVYFHDGLDIVAEYNGGDQLQRTYVTPDLDQNLSVTSSGSTYYYLTDALGSIRQLIDGDEATQNAYDYEAFGKQYGAPTENLNQPFRFTARESDAETVLQYSRARFYSHALGRWLSRDPAGYTDGMNLYEYVGGRPTTATDPTGLGRRDPSSDLPATEEVKCDPLCGPDVTGQVTAVLNKVTAKFKSLTKAQQKALCGAFTSSDPDPNHAGEPMYLNAWDIEELHHQQWINMAPYAPPCATPPECINTVEVSGKCFYAGSVNYVLFGHIWNLCGKRNATGSFLIWGYKGGIPLVKKPVRNYQPSQDWFDAGYNGWPAAPTPAADRPQCSPECPVPYSGAPFSVYLGTVGTF